MSHILEGLDQGPPKPNQSIPVLQRHTVAEPEGSQNGRPHFERFPMRIVTIPVHRDISELVHNRIPKKIILDRDPRFIAHFSKELCRILGIKQNLSTAFHPQTDGQSKRTNQSLEQYLRIVCSQDQKEWSKWLPLAQYTHNSWPSSITKKTPLELILGYTPPVHQPLRSTEIPSIQEWIDKITKLQSSAQEVLQKAQNNLLKITKFKTYDVGQRIWLEGTNLKIPYESTKLSPKRYGPFRVVAIISPIAYKLELLETWKIHPVFHASLLSPYKEMEYHGTNFLEPPPIEIEGGELEWEVEKILRDRTYRKKKQYLVRWKDYLPAHDSWVDESDLHAPKLIEEFFKQKPCIRTLSPDKEQTCLTSYSPPLLPPSSTTLEASPLSALIHTATVSPSSSSSSTTWNP